MSVTRAALYSSDVFADSVLDDADDAIFASVMPATERLIESARREEKRSRATAQRVAGKRSEHTYEPIPEHIQAFLAANPAF